MEEEGKERGWEELGEGREPAVRERCMPAELAPPAGAAALIGRALTIEGDGEGDVLPTWSVSQPSAAAADPAPPAPRSRCPAPRCSLAPLLLLLARLRGILVGPGGGVGRLASSGLPLLDFGGRRTGEEEEGGGGARGSGSWFEREESEEVCESLACERRECSSCARGRLYVDTEND
jgi:hypothetical protein